jgi:hypothetical protein
MKRAVGHGERRIELCNFQILPLYIFLFRSYVTLGSMSRQASLSRKTNETQIDVSINLDCGPGSTTPQTIEISTGIGFLDHVRYLSRSLELVLS